MASTNPFAALGGDIKIIPPSKCKALKHPTKYKTPVKTKIKQYKSNLLVFDLNGLFMRKCDNSTKPGSGGNVKPVHKTRNKQFSVVQHRHKSDIYSRDTDNADILPLNSYTVQARPGCKYFLKQLLATYEVAIFSSTMEENLNKIIPWLFGTELSKKLFFVWGRTRTHIDKDTSSTSTSHDTIKLLPDIYNAYAQWSNTNTLIIDHDQAKIRHNNPVNIICPPEWAGTLPANRKNENSYKLLLDNIEVKLNLLNVF